MRLRPVFLTILSIILFLAVASMGSRSSNAQTNDQDNFGFVRFAHTAVDVPAVDIYIGSGQTPIVSNLSYGQFTDFLALPTNLSGYTMRAAGSGPSGAELFKLDWGVKANKSELILVSGLAANKSAVLEPITLVRNDTKGKARIRVVDTVSGGPHLSVTSKQGGTFSQDQDYLKVSADTDVAPGPLDLEVKDPSGKVLGSLPTLTLQADKVYVLLLTGGANGSPALTITPIVSDQETTRVQIVNQSAGAIDVYLKGQDKPFVAALAAGQTSQFMAVPSGAATLVVRTPGSSASDKELAALEVQLRPGRELIVTITGSGSTFQLAVSSDILAPLTPAATAGAAGPGQAATMAATAAPAQPTTANNPTAAPATASATMGATSAATTTMSATMSATGAPTMVATVAPTNVK